MFNFFMPTIGHDADGKEWLCIETISIKDDGAYRLAVDAQADLPAPVMLVKFPIQSSVCDRETE